MQRRRPQPARIRLTSAASPSPLPTCACLPATQVIGTAGAGFSTNIQIPPPAFNELVLLNHGYARVMLHNASALEWQFVDDVAGEVLDHMWILKA